MWEDNYLCVDECMCMVCTVDREHNLNVLIIDDTSIHIYWRNK